MTTIRCTYCPARATGIFRARGGSLPVVTVPHCDRCWDRAYEAVRGYPERTQSMIDPGPPDLLDLLPDESEM
jgi:hypothetical protein